MGISKPFMDNTFDYVLLLLSIVTNVLVFYTMTTQLSNDGTSPGLKTKCRQIVKTGSQS